MSQERPLGFAAAEKDWLGLDGRAMAYRDWSSLTLGEQRRYAEAELLGQGVSMSVKAGAQLDVRLELPPETPALDAAEQASLEFALRRTLGQTVAAIMQLREFRR